MRLRHGNPFAALWLILLLSCQESRPAFFTHPAPVKEPQTGLRASDCGSCHQDQYNDWKHSTHSMAYLDLQFQSEIAKPGAPVQLCMNCHLPLGNQHETLADGSANPSFDAALQREGVTCAGCHVRQENGHSIVVGTDSTSPDAPHPVVADREYLLDRCETCHQAAVRLDDQYVCSFNTVKEWQESPYDATHCVQCHMEKGSGESGPFSRHLFPGGGVPKRFDLFPYLLTVRHQTGLQFESGSVSLDGAGRLRFALKITNAGAGHYVPTADPERFVLVRAMLLDSQGRELQRREYRIGQIWQWQPARKLSDNRLAPLETRQHTFLFSAEEEARFLDIQAFHVRLSEENATFMKKTAHTADPAFQKQIAQIEKHYPRYALIWSERLDLLTKSSTAASREELNRLSSMPERRTVQGP